MDFIPQPLQKHINHQLQICADAFSQAHLLAEWRILWQALGPELTQLAIAITR